ncbi:MAG: diacylglycerol/lipid kinase family protein [Roseiflexaceae bacterium]
MAEQRHSRIFVVLNPMAGSSTAEDVRQALDRHFAARAWQQEIYETTGREQVADVVRNALKHNYDMVVAAGGDGTVSDVAEALVHTDIPLGILPVGTANVLARELGIPIDLDGACELIVGEHMATSIDAMQVGDHYFMLHIGVGIDSLTMRDTARAAKRRFGRAAYLWTGARWLIGYQPRRFTIAVDGRRYRPRAAQVLIANGGALGMRLLRWGPHIRPDDGQIDVCVISARTLWDYLRVGWHMLLSQHDRDPNIRYLSATRSIAVDADRPLPVQADGEIIGQTPVQVRVVPDAVRVVVPRASVEPTQQPAEMEPVGV